jgi:uncharacterized protein (TIGR00251 family)
VAEIRFRVRLQPRADRSSVDGVVEGSLRVRVTAPPVDGAANEALVRLLAAELRIRRGAIRVVGGTTSRNKVVAIEGVEPAALLARWPGLGV